ncbi:hypothetical protein EV426DRAFT_528477 [Tirmania nivea]|nr:hypothetical protein EV426DRAFT_528477 [Tirmania nivea]
MVTLAPVEITTTNFPLPSPTAWSATEAFNTGIGTRDRDACVVCGWKIRACVDHAYIIPRTENETWEELREQGLIPLRAKSVAHECRNGILMCKNHHSAFDSFYFYIRYIPERLAYVFVNHSKHLDLAPWNDKDVRIDPDDPRAPWAVLFAYHEGLVRASKPFGASVVTLPGPPSSPSAHSTHYTPAHCTQDTQDTQPPSTQDTQDTQDTQSPSSPSTHYTPAHDTQSVRTTLKPIYPNTWWVHFNPDEMKAQGFRNWDY